MNNNRTAVQASLGRGLYSYNGVSRSDSTACKMHVACSMLAEDHDPARSAMSIDEHWWRLATSRRAFKMVARP